jgi:hypothetical protein
MTICVFEPLGVEEVRRTTTYYKYKCLACEREMWSRYSNHQPHRECSVAAKEMEMRRDEAGERLGIKPKHIYRYGKALIRWSLSGFPTRTDDEVESIYETHCKPCDEFVEGRCRQCGCPVVSEGMILKNKLAMGSEVCPLGKWR